MRGATRLGDALLLQVALRLMNWLLPGDTLARLGGDEFVLLLKIWRPTWKRRESRCLCKAGDQVRNRSWTPYAMTATNSCSTASIGITLFPKRRGRGRPVARGGTPLWYRAKDLGRNW